MNTPQPPIDIEALPPGDTTVGMIMRPPLTTVELDSHLAGVAYQIKHAGETALVVVDDLNNNSPVAIVTDADIVNAVAEGKDLEQTRIRGLVRPGLTTIRPGDTVNAAVEIMLRSGIQHLPVVDEAGGIIGIVDLVDMCRAMISM